MFNYPQDISKGLVIYGAPSTGKSTLELNLRRHYFTTPLTDEPFQFDGTRCFLGKTAKKTGDIMATGGAEALLELPQLPEAEWFVAALPSSGRPGTKVVTEFLQTLPWLCGICLYSEDRGPYHKKRTNFFSGRDPKHVYKASRPVDPPFVPRENCLTFTTEDLSDALLVGKVLLDGLGMLDSSVQVEVSPFMTLEEMGTDPAFIERFHLNKERRDEIAENEASSH